MNEHEKGGIWVRIRSLRIAQIIVELLRGYSIEAHNEARQTRSAERAKELRAEGDAAHAQAKAIEQQIDPSKRV